VSGIDYRSHGGRTRELALAAGIAEEELLDFSANLNPAGPPAWLGEAVAEGARRVGVYPDPDADLVRAAAALRYALPADHFLFADGADTLILALPRALGALSCILPWPSYTGYARAALQAQVPVIPVVLDPGRDFSLADPAFLGRLAELLASCKPPALFIAGSPNNPAGGRPPLGAMRDLARRFPSHCFALDESFAELAGENQGAIGSPEPNLLVIRSLTKTWAVPGARIGFACGQPGILARLRAELGAWPLSCFAEAIAIRALADAEGVDRAAALVAREEAALVASLRELAGVTVYRSGANFFLLRFSRRGGGDRAAAALLREGIAIRTFKEDEGLDGSHARIAVRSAPENRRLLDALSRFLAGESSPAGPAGRQG
jgi:histidinol-phosphate/aromatic aminotransferase/cobyric acid decarboxylase-like protein